MGQANFFYQVANCVEDIRDFKCAVNSNRYDLADMLRQKGYVFADRTVKASIPLKSSADFKRLCRLKIEESKLNARITEIAKENFREDVRFFVSFPPKFDEQLLENYLSEIKICYVCCCKEEIAGFIEVVEIMDENKNWSGVIRLAAVDAKYRLSGAALSLYAGAAELCRQKNFRRIEGRISCRNMPALNLYSSFGAAFSEPLDIYIRS